MRTKFFQRFRTAGSFPGARFFALAAGVAGLVFYAYGQQASGPQPERIDYNWQVRPILSDNCYRCHGPDAKSRQAGLRLDQQESA